MSARQDARQDIIALLERHLGIPAQGLGPDTAIGKRAVRNSIQIHRFYAELNRAGYAVEDYFTIQTFGQLLDALGLGGASGSVEVAGSGAVGLREGEATGAGAASGGAAPSQDAPNQAASVHHDPSFKQAAPDQRAANQDDRDQAAPFLPLPGLGVDAQPVDQMPRPDGAAPRLDSLLGDAFYAENFTRAELGHALDRPDPWATLAGLFAAKEAVVKADSGRGGGRLKEVAISHDADGRPGLPGFRLSITHAGSLALAVALVENTRPASDQTGSPAPAGSSTRTGGPTRSGRPLFPGWVLFATGLALGLGAALLWG